MSRPQQKMSRPQ